MSLKNNRNIYAYNNVYIIKTLQNTQLGCWENRFSRETEVSLLFFFYFGTPAGLFYNSVSEYVKNENTYCACTPYKYTDNAYLHLKKMR